MIEFPNIKMISCIVNMNFIQKYYDKLDLKNSHGYIIHYPFTVEEGLKEYETKKKEKTKGNYRDYYDNNIGIDHDVRVFYLKEYDEGIRLKAANYLKHEVFLEAWNHQLAYDKNTKIKKGKLYVVSMGYHTARENLTPAYKMVQVGENSTPFPSFTGMWELKKYKPVDKWYNVVKRVEFSKQLDEMSLHTAYVTKTRKGPGKLPSREKLHHYYNFAFYVIAIAFSMLEEPLKEIKDKKVGELKAGELAKLLRASLTKKKDDDFVRPIVAQIFNWHKDFEKSFEEK